ncbi:hypothetical protein AB0D16_40385 [Streptomyces sp. NPDC048161]
MRIAITDTSGTVTETTTSDPDVARQFEQLPFEADHIAVVTVTTDDD